MTSTLVFFMLNVTPQSRNVASMTVTASLSFSALPHIRDMPPAYSRTHISSSSVGFLQCLSWPSVLKHLVTPSRCKCGSSWQITTRQMLKKGGASTQPCLKPTFVQTGGESTSLQMTAKWCVWRSLMSATSFGGAPLLSKICQAIQ